jgi:hypothetical protein
MKKNKEDFPQPQVTEYHGVNWPAVRRNTVRIAKFLATPVMAIWGYFSF